jgi:squalene-associated FAD-dependent desaturase
MSRLVHVIGAGLSGLAAAVQLQRRGARVVLHEAAPHAGGRCRSYFDATLNATIDNGNHFIVSGNSATLAYARAIGAAEELVGPTQPDYPFFDLKDSARWTLRLSSGRLPKWIFDPQARVPGTQPADYLPLASLLWAKPGRTVAESMRAQGRVWDALARPFLRAAMNAEPAEASALLAAQVLRETLAAGGQACRPLTAKAGLGRAFVEPALRLLQYGGADIRLGARLEGIGFAGSDSNSRVSSLDFGSGPLAVAASDGVVLAVPPDVAQTLVPELTAPNEFRAILVAHFAVDPPHGFAPMTCVLNGIGHWLFAYDGRMSITVSSADRLIDTPHDELAKTLWREVAAVAGLPAAPMPLSQIVIERRATLAAIPSQESLRPATRMRWPNLMLAGDWTATGLPATIEGSIRSGQQAADALMNSSMERP